MTVRGKDDDFTREDLRAVGRAFDVTDDGVGIIDQVEAALGLWVPEAREAGISAEWITKIEGLFRRLGQDA
jgi:hypothetical protein